MARNSCAVALLFGIASPWTFAATPPTGPERIEIIGVTPTYGVGLPRSKTATNIQAATSAQLEQQHSLDISDFLNRNFGSVTINAAQNNPLQPDVQYRGFTASPLLGLPQGIAVFVAGVRANEAFGGTVNWDLLPESIVSSMELTAGSNPLFGLNTLGGALAIRTKDGFNHPGYAIEASGGSFGRSLFDFEAGGTNGEFGYYVNARRLDEDGWRDHSPTTASNLFGSFGWHTDATTLDFDYFYANTDLTGNGVSPAQLLAENRNAVFTTPDKTGNQQQMFVLNGSHWLQDELQLSGTVFYRYDQVDSFNGDGSPFTACDDGAGNAGLVEEDDFVDQNDDETCGDLEFDPARLLRDQHGDVISDQFDAVNNIGDRNQTSYGATLQTTWRATLFDRPNQLIVGAAFDRADVDYRANVEVAELQPNRSTSRSGLFAIRAATAVDVSTHSASAYFTDTWSVTEALSLTLSGRYNDSSIQLNNAGQPRDEDDDGADDLDGKHGFARFNPALGATYQFLPALNGYVGYSEASRTPTPVELACASPTAPCSLPNTFIADPPLNQVVAKTYETGLRGDVEDVQWNVGAFDTTNSNDIVFQATGGISGNQGFFSNVGDTRRSGVEIGANGLWNGIAWFFNYSYVRAVFLDSFVATSPAHPDAVDLNGDGDAREIRVRNGDRIPGIPAHSAKVGIDWRATAALSLGGDMTFNSGQYLRGDEANLLDQTGTFAVVNVRAEYRFSEQLSVFATVQNLFDVQYETFGLIADPTEVAQFEQFTNHRFYGPAPPRGGWIGVRASL
jgi:iron complex outermembrane receptor protein